MYDLRLELFRHLQFLSLSFFDRNPVGRLMTRMTNDIDALTEMVTRGVVSIFGDVAMLVFISIAMLLLDWRLALLTFVSLPILIAITAYFRGMMRDSFRADPHPPRAGQRLPERDAVRAWRSCSCSRARSRRSTQFDVLNRDRCSRRTRVRYAR